MTGPPSGGSRLSEVINRISLHTHLCLIYETQEQQLAAAIPFILRGMERGEKCIYMANESTATAVFDVMRGQGADVDSAVRKGMLTLANEREACPKPRCFDPDELIRFWAGALGRAKLTGFSTARLAGEMTWVLDCDPGTQRLVEYEAKLNYFLRDHDALAMCQYDGKRFPYRNDP